jgi:hypothetical protein
MNFSWSWDRFFLNQYKHLLDGPFMFFISNKQEIYYIDNSCIVNPKLYYNHPDVKKHMLLKAIKELK